MPTWEVDIRGTKIPIEAADEAEAKTKALQLSQQPQYNKGYADTYFAQGTSGVNEGLGNTLGLPVDLMNAGIGLGMKGINAVAGTDLQPSEKPFLGSQQINDWMRGAGAIQPESADPSKQIVRRVGESVGSAVIPGGGVVKAAAQPVKAGMGLLASSLGGGSTAAASEQLLPDNPTAEMLAELVGSFGTAGATAALKKKAATKSARAGVPSVEKLEQQADAKYKEAEKTGITASQQQTQGLAADMRQIATDEGLISPTGRLSEAYPKAKEAIRMLDDYAQGEMTVPQMGTVRKVLKDAAKSTDDAERRVASIMLEKFDDFTSPLAPPLKQARALYHAAMKGETLQTADELAGSRAGQFTGSGYENARRTEYRGLERKIIKGQERGFKPAEAAAISKVAQGTRGSNTARNVGRMAPTGPMSFAATAGVPFMIGNALGGPYVGAAASGVAAGTGYMGRAIATHLGKKHAELASLITRSGGNLPLAALDKATLAKVLSALGTSAAANLQPK